MPQVDRILDDVGLGHQVRCDVDRGIGDDERFGVAADAHQIGVGNTPCRSQAGVGLQDGTEQFVAVERPLHHRLDISVGRKSDGLRCGGMAVFGIDQRPFADVHTGFLCRIPDLFDWTDQDGIDHPPRNRVRHGFDRA